MEIIKIAIIEDSQVASKVLKTILHNLGYADVNVYLNPQDFMDNIAICNYDLLLIDVDLGGDISGIDVVHSFRDRYPETPFLYVTGHTDPKTLAKMQATKPWGFLHKPVQQEELQNALQLVSKNKTLSEQFAHQKMTVMLQERIIDEVKILNKELTDTNSHLITATFRERELKKELQHKNVLIEAQHKQITDSINYAKRIQNSMVAKEAHFAKYFTQACMYYKPKDVVSGDFPWFYEKGEYIYLAVVDCTGHGVPGAMLATIGVLLLNDIVNNDGEVTTQQLLQELDYAIQKTLNQQADAEAANDGMDIAIVRYHTPTQQLQFSGAHRQLYVISEGEVHKYKGSPYPIGGLHYRRKKTFERSDIQLKKGDVFTLFSDGVPDQFGGGKDEKFGNPRIIDILLDNYHRHTIHQVKDDLAAEIRNWMHSDQDIQTDDMLLIAAQV